MGSPCVLGTVIEIPRCGIGGCNRVAMREKFQLEMRDVDGNRYTSGIRLCWYHTKKYGLDEAEEYECDDQK